MIDLEALTEGFETAGRIYGKYDGTGQWICSHDLYDRHLSVVKDHYREKCTVYLYDKDTWIYERRDQQAVYYVDNACGYHRTAYKSSD